MGPPVPDEHLFRVVDALDEVADETGKTVPQIALNWLLQRPTVATVIIGARNEEQLRQNLGAVGWSLTREQIARWTRRARRRRLSVLAPAQLRGAEPAPCVVERQTSVLLTRTRDPVRQIAKLIPAFSPGRGSLEPVSLVSDFKIKVSSASACRNSVYLSVRPSSSFETNATPLRLTSRRPWQLPIRCRCTTSRDVVAVNAGGAVVSSDTGGTEGRTRSAIGSGVNTEAGGDVDAFPVSCGSTSTMETRDDPSAGPHQ